MGVLYLTSFVAENRRALATVVTRPAPPPRTSVESSGASTTHGSQASEVVPPEQKITLVCDAWAVIFHEWSLCFGDSRYGGDYEGFCTHMRTLVETWRKVGLEPVFVFDGLVPPAKLPTVLRRRNRTAAANSAFMRSSPISRRSRAFQADCQLSPPLLRFSILQAFAQCQPPVQTHFVSFEADGPVAELAERTRGYALSNDSDFFVLCARGSQIAGYVPLPSLEYIYSSERKWQTGQGASEQANGSDGQGEDEGFVQVNTRKRGAKRSAAKRPAAAPATITAGSAEITALASPIEVEGAPSEDSAKPVLHAVRFDLHTSSALSKLTKLPSSLLPLLAAFAGNDYTDDHASNTLFRHVPHGTERIHEALDILRSEWEKMASQQQLAGSRRGLQQTSSGASTPRASVSRKGMGRQAPSRLGQATSAVAALALGDDGGSESGFSASSSAIATPTGARTPFTATAAMRAIKAAQPVDPVRQLVEAAVDRALARAEASSSRYRHVTPVEREAFITSIIDSAATYSLLGSGSSGAADGGKGSRHISEFLSLVGAGTFMEVDTDEGPAWVGPDHAAMAALTTTAFARKLADARIVQAYARRYRRGAFSERLVAALTQRDYICQLFAEDPDVPSVNLGMCRDLRRWIYAVLFDAWGMWWARETMEEPREVQPPEAADGMEARRSGGITYREGEAPDDLISVITDPSASESEDGGSHADTSRVENPHGTEALASSANGDDDGDSEPETDAIEEKPPPAVMEYARKGERLVGEMVQIHNLADMLARDRASGVVLPSTLAQLLGQHQASLEASGEIPGHLRLSSDPPPPTAALLPANARLELFLHAHAGACTPAICALQPADLRPLAAALRKIVVGEAERLGESRRRFGWTKSELWAGVVSGVRALRGASQAVESIADYLNENKEAAEEKDGEDEEDVGRSMGDEDADGPSTRAIHVGTVLQLVLTTSYQLGQALLLTPDSFVDAALPPSASSRGTDAGSLSTEESRGPSIPAPHLYFHGETLHALLARAERGVDIVSAARLDEDHEAEEAGQSRSNGHAATAAPDVESSTSPWTRIFDEARRVMRALLAEEDSAGGGGPDAAGLESLLAVDLVQQRRERKKKKRRDRAEAAAATAAAAAAAATAPSAGARARRNLVARNAFEMLGEGDD